MSLKRHAYLIVRPTAPAVFDVEGVIVIEGHPTVPGTWTSHAVDAGWSEHRRPDGLRLHALRLNTIATDNTLGLWLVVQREPDGFAALADLAAAPSNTIAAPLKTVWEAARSGHTTARAVLRHLPAWKVTGYTKDPDTGDPVPFAGEVTRIFSSDSGRRIPANVFTGGVGPWHFNGDGAQVAHGASTEVLHVTAWHRPGLLQSIHGYDDHTPEDGTLED